MQRAANTTAAVAAESRGSHAHEQLALSPDPRRKPLHDVVCTNMRQPDGIPDASEASMLLIAVWLVQACRGNLGFTVFRDCRANNSR